MNNWSLSELLGDLHDDVERRLGIVRRAFGHSTTKGDATESVWLDLLSTYLPSRYQVASAHVVDSDGAFSQQIDVVIFDRQYSPFIFQYQGQVVVPAESVYAVLEAKQSINSEQVRYARDKISSVRALTRTSLPIPHAGGTFPAKNPQHIIGGLLTFESDWNPPLGNPLIDSLSGGDKLDHLDLGCVAARGTFWSADDGYVLRSSGKPATSFLLELIARLQSTATVPMIDIRAYARWLDRSENPT